jgi:hypothetical protein
VLRLNAFITLAMSQNEAIRVNYRPNGLICSLPVLSGLISFTDQMFGHAGPAWCTPVRTAAL